MNSYNYSYNVLINRLEAFAAGHFLIKRFTHGQIDMSDQLQDDQYPFMHVTPDTIEPVPGAMNFGFHIMFADIPRDKEYKVEYQREVISDCIRLGQDLIAEVKNGLELFGFDVQLLDTPTFEPFMEEQKNTVTGVAFTLRLSVPWDWSACDIPAIWSTGGTSGSGGSGTGYGIELQTNGVDNIVQTKLNLVDGANITITDLGNGSVSIDAVGGTVDYVSTAFNVNHTTATGNQYVIGDRVWYNGSVYQCIANNDAINPTNTSYWSLVAVGYRLRQTPVDWNASSGDYQILNKPTLATVATSGDYNDLINTPGTPDLQAVTDTGNTTTNDLLVQGANDFIGQVSSQVVTVYNTVTGAYAEMSVTTSGQLVLSDGTSAGILSINDIDNSNVQLEFPNKTTGSYTIATTADITAQVNSDWNSISGVSQILNKPTIPAAQVNSDWNAVSGVAQILNKPTLATVATTGSYTDLINQPTIPAAQIQSDWTQANTAALDYIKNKPTITTPVNADWNAISGLAQILNKPTIPAAQVNSDWNAVSGLAQILNKPFVPSTLDSLTDVNTPAPTNGQVLTFNTSTGQWIASTPTSGGSGTVTSVGLTMPAPANPAFSVGGSPVTTSGTLAVAANGTIDQYIDGTGALRTLPSTGGGGGQIFYFNGNTSQGTIGGNAFYQLGTAANTGAAANFTRATTGVIARFITNVGSPNHLVLPSGVWTIDVYLSETGGGSNHAQIEAKLYKVTGTALTLIGTSPIEEVTNGNVVDLYTFAISVPNTVTLASDRVAILFDILNTNGKTVTIYTEASRIGEVHSTYAIGLSSLNGLTDSTQTFATGTAGTDFAINSSGSVHTFNLPTASASNRGALSTADWTTFNAKLTGNAAITGATKTKITYDSKGLVTAGADLAASDMPTGIDAANIGAGTVSNTEFAYLDGVTSSIQTQLNSKSPVTLLYQSQNATNIPAASTYFGCLFGGALSIVSADTLRRTPIATAGTLSKLYVQTSTAQPGTGSLVCTVRKNGVDQALTLTIAAGSAAGVFTDLVNSVSVAAGDLLGMKFQNNAPATVSANVLSNQVILTI